MLKWENFVIQHEKMKKLREDIRDSFKSQSAKIEEIKTKQKQLSGITTHFSRICQILEQCQSENQHSFVNNSINNDENSFDVAI